MNRKLLSRETLEKWVREYARGAIATGRRFEWTKSTRSEEMCRRFRE